MNFHSISQPQFNLLESNSKERIRNKISIAIREGRIDLSRALYTALGMPTFVEIGWSFDRNSIGIKIGNEAKLPVKHSDKSGGSIYGKYFSRKLHDNIDAFKSVSLKDNYIVVTNPDRVDEWFVFESKNMIVCKKQKRHNQLGD